MRVVFLAILHNITVLAAPALRARVQQATDSARMDVRTLKAPPFIPSADLSDHWSYWKLRYKAVMIADSSFYRNPNHRKATDTIETLDFEKMREGAKGVCWALLNMK